MNEQPEITELLKTFRNPLENGKARIQAMEKLQERGYIPDLIETVEALKASITEEKPC